MEKIREEQYKLVSAGALSVEAVAKPSVVHSHKFMVESSRKLYKDIERTLNTLEKDWNLSWIVKPARKITRVAKELTKFSLRSSYNQTMSSLNTFEKQFNSSQEHLERYFDQNGIDLHKNWAFSLENRETIRQLLSYINEKILPYEAIPYRNLWLNLKAYICIQHRGRILYHSFKYLNQDILSHTIKDLLHINNFAIGVYGNLITTLIMKRDLLKLFQDRDSLEILSEYAGIDISDVILCHFNSDNYLPAHAVAIDRKTASIIVAIRGTLSALDCIADIKAVCEEFELIDPIAQTVIQKGKLHAGIYKSAMNVYNVIRSTLINLLQEHADYNIVLTGHSLGAATASILSLLLMNDEEFCMCPLKVYSFGCPPVMTPELNEFVKPFTLTCVYGYDWVTRISLGGILDIYDSVIQIHKINKLKPDLMTELNDLSLDQISSLYYSLLSNSTHEKLVMPGKLLQIYERGRHEEAEPDAAYTISFMSTEYYQEMLFTKSMLTDHSPALYTAALEDLHSKLESLN